MYVKYLKQLQNVEGTTTFSIVAITFHSLQSRVL